MIKTSNLLYLDYSSYVAQDYFVQLDLRLWKYYDYVPPSLLSSWYDHSKPADYWGDATKLISAIRKVVTLHLSADSLEVSFLLFFFIFFVLLLVIFCIKTLFVWWIRYFISAVNLCPNSTTLLSYLLKATKNVVGKYCHLCSRNLQT